MSRAQTIDAGPISQGLVTLRPLLAVCAVLAASLLANFDTRLLAISLPDVRTGLGLDVDEGAWLSTAATAPQLVVAPCVVWLATVFGPRRVLLGPSLLFAAISVAITMTHDIAGIFLLHAARACLLGLFVPATLMVIFRNLPQRWWIAALAVFALRLPLSGSVGEWLAGAPVATFGWRFLYVEDLVLAPLIAISAHFGLPREPPNRDLLAQADWGGMLLLGFGTAAIYAGLDQGNRLDWRESGVVLGLLMAGALLLACFLLNESLVHTPWASLSVLANRNLALGLALVVAYAVSSLCASYLVTNFLTTVAGLRPEEQSEALLRWGAAPATLTIVVGALFATRLDVRFYMLGGFALLALAAWTGSYLTHDWSPDTFRPVIALGGVAEALTFLGVLVFILANSNPARATSLSAYVQVARLDGAELGAALMATWLRVREQVHSAYLTPHVSSGSAKAEAALAKLAAGVLHRGPDEGFAAERATSILAGIVHREASVLASADAFRISFWAAVAGLLLLALTKRAPKGPLAN
jgi:DHA2 family multidrug resistance protein